MIGTDDAGDNQGNGQGVVIDNSGNNTIGGTTFASANIIGFSTTAGVSISGSSATGNVVAGNDIGTNAAGQNLHNLEGVVIDDVGSNTIGGIVAGMGNTIGFNTAAGVSISGTSATGNVVAGNDIGTNAAASNLGNAVGVILFDDPGNTIGGTTLGAANVIGFNSGAGILLSSSNMGDLVLGNYIGTDSFNDKMGNATGIEIDGSSSNSIGGTVSGTIDPTQVIPAWFSESLSYSGSDRNGDPISGTPGTVSGIGNVIDFNRGAGLSITPGDGQSTDNVVMGNLIGLNVVSVEGNSDTNHTLIENAGNLGDGIDLSGSETQSNSIGYALGFSYVPSAIGGTIIGQLKLADAFSSGTSVLQTFPQQVFSAGQNLSGTVAVGNFITANNGAGVSLSGSVSQNLVVGNTIGATSTIAGNTTNPLSGNAGSGIAITNAMNNTIGDVLTSSVGSLVSLDAGANVISGNADDGIAISLVSTTGSPNLITGNLVALNSQNGIYLVGDLSGDQSLARITDNFIGTTLDGTSAYDANDDPQGNGLSGILLESNSTSLGPSPLVAVTVSGNVVSDNGLSGVTVQSANNARATASALIQDNLIGTDKTGGYVSTVSETNTALTFGNVDDGIQLNNVTGVTIGGTAAGSAGSVSLTLSSSGGNLIAGNLGEGIVLNNANADTINSNLIGVVLSSTGQQVQVEARDGYRNNAGNLSDGIFALNSTGDVIQGNLISNNRGYGIHAFDDLPRSDGGPVVASIDLLIAGNFIGTNDHGTSAVDSSAIGLGNGADGVFLDSVGDVTVGGTTAGARNVISGNHANGVDVLQATSILIAGNEIGTDLQGFSAPGNPTLDLGNDSNGIFINQTSDVTIGGITTGAGNTISGNHASGVFLSGTVSSSSGGTTSNQNVIEGNWIGVGVGSQGQTTAVPNAVAGIILSNADSNTVGGSTSAAANVVSGNSLDGILLVNDAQFNVIENNLIGTDPAASTALGNSADGIFLLGSTAITIRGVTANPTASTISGNTIASNLIAGNNEDGIQVFGTGAISNTFTQNFVGLSSQGNPMANGADGVLLNDAGAMNVVGGSGQGNIISGNNQAGVEITGSPNATSGTVVEGNFIGTDPSGNVAVGNGSYGVLVYGSSANTIGGATTSPGTGLGNVIGSNSQAGIQIFNPGGAHARDNLVVGNLIGTNAAGTGSLGNGSDGVQILNASDNTIGGASTLDRNVISGNAGNGVLIDQFPNLSAAADVVLGNFIGTNAAGTAALGNLANGVELIDGSANTVGGISGGATLADTQVAVSGEPGNLISGNAQWGVMIQLTGASAGQPQSVIQGNVIGLDASRTFAIGNGQGGILVNNVTTQALNETIGGSVAGAGNLITGNNNVGIQLLGGTAGSSGFNDVVQGNLIGLNAAGRVVNVSGGTGNVTGILVDNSPGDLIGGTSSADRNVISGNSQSGIQLFNVLSTGDLVLGNFIGTNLTGNAFPAGSNEADPLQSAGVLINGASGDTVGQVGAGNLLSGNVVGVEITGVKQNNGQVLGSGNVVAGNLIGTDASGTQPVSNLDLGVFVNNSQGNVIGPGNDIAANGIAGVEILNDGSQQNLVTGNMIGEGIGGQIFSSKGRSVLSSNGPEAGIPIFADAQLNGVVVLGASNNTIGVDKRIAGQRRQHDQRRRPGWRLHHQPRLRGRGLLGPDQ